MQSGYDCPPEFVLEEDSDDDMKLRDDDRTWLESEIATQIKTAIDALGDALRPHGLRQAAFWLRQLGPIAATIAIFVATVVFAATQFNLANTRLAKQATFEANSERDLKEIREDIKAIRGDLAKQNMINHASLSLSDFKATLPELSSAMATAKQQNVKVAPRVINDLQVKLIAAAGAGAGAGAGAIEAPGFWPAAADFISYRSQSNIPDASSLLGSNLPTCTDHEPHPPTVLSADPTKFGIRFAYYENCRLTLDSAFDDAKVNSLLLNETINLTFRHCLVVYRGGNINLIVAVHDRMIEFHGVADAAQKSGPIVVSGNTLYFSDCLFDFKLDTQPPPLGQDFTHNLLTSNGSISFTVKAPATHS